MNERFVNKAEAMSSGAPADARIGEIPNLLRYTPWKVCEPRMRTEFKSLAAAIKAVKNAPKHGFNCKILVLTYKDGYALGWDDEEVRNCDDFKSRLAWSE